MTKKILIIGGGGHAKVVIDALKYSKEYTVYGIIDPKLPAGGSVLGVKVLGPDDKLDGIFNKGIENAFIGIGSIGDCSLRKKVYSKLKAIGFKLPYIVHPKAIVSDNVDIGEGTFIAAGAIINPGTRIGRNAIINTASSIDHDCMIGDFVHVAPGVTLSGGVQIGCGTHVGTGARITQYLKIGRKCIVGAGQTVRYDMADGRKSYSNVAGQPKKSKQVFVIAEAGVNHNGNIGIARRLIDAAILAGADAVKFQTFTADDLATCDAPCAKYQKRALKDERSQHNMLKRLELSESDHSKIIDYCKARGIAFISSPFDMTSVEMLVRLRLNIIKIPSGQITDYRYLNKVGALNKKIMLSTGMSDIEEIAAALSVLTKAGTVRSNIILMQCTSEYPAPFDHANLRAIVAMRNEFGLETGYSDHTEGIEASIAAAVLGACVIEKHLTLDRRMKGPDHKASLEPQEFALLVRSIRNIEKALGDGIKKVMPSESRNRAIVRKSIVASRSVKKGERFTEENITTKRPGTGMSPMKWDSIVGKYAKRPFKKDELIRL